MMDKKLTSVSSLSVSRAPQQQVSIQPEFNLEMQTIVFRGDTDRQQEEDKSYNKLRTANENFKRELSFMVDADKTNQFMNRNLKTSNSKINKTKDKIEIENSQDDSFEAMAEDFGIDDEDTIRISPDHKASTLRSQKTKRPDNPSRSSSQFTANNTLVIPGSSPTPASGSEPSQFSQSQSNQNTSGSGPTLQPVIDESRQSPDRSRQDRVGSSLNLGVSGYTTTQRAGLIRTPTRIVETVEIPEKQFTLDQTELANLAKQVLGGMTPTNKPINEQLSPGPANQDNFDFFRIESESCMTSSFNGADQYRSDTMNLIEQTNTFQQRFLSKKFFEEFDYDLQSMVKPIIEASSDKQIKAITEGKVKPKRERTNRIIMRKKQSKDNVVEENLRVTRLKKQLLEKNKLMEQLEHINSNIELLEQRKDNQMTQSSKNIPSIMNQGKSLLALPPAETQPESHALWLSKIKKDKQERKRIKRQRQQLEQARQKQLFDDLMKQKQKEEEKKLQEIQEKRLKIQQKIQDQKIKVKQMRQSASEGRLREKPLFKQLEEKFSQQQLIPELEKRKEELSRIRNMMKPISNKELKHHAKKHQEILEKKAIERKIERLRVHSYDESYDPSKFQTKVSRQLLKQDLIMKEKQEEEEQQKRQLFERKDNYAKYVREMYQPSVSKKKEYELEQQKAKIKHPVRQKIDIPKSAGPPPINKARLHLEPYDDDNPDQENLLDGDITPQNIDRSRRRVQPGQKNGLRESSGKPPLAQGRGSLGGEQIKKQKYPDYLQELRQNRISQETRANSIWDESSIDSHHHVSSKDKFEQIRYKAKVLEEKAKRKEEILQISRGDDSEVNDMLIGAIKAKLAILDHI